MIIYVELEPGDANPETNQTPATLNQRDETPGVENPPQPPQPADPHVPPTEVPGQPQAPEHVPEKSRKHHRPTLVKK